MKTTRRKTTSKAMTTGITRAQYNAAIKASPCAKEALEALFPQFKPVPKPFIIKDFEVSIDVGKLVWIAKGFAPTTALMEKCLGLNEHYTWKMITRDGMQFIIPTKK